MTYDLTVPVAFVAVGDGSAGSCDVVDFCFFPSIEPAYIMIARRSLSSIFPSRTLRPWSISFLYSAGLFSSFFERFAPSFGVVVFDFFLLRPTVLYFCGMMV